MLAGLSVFSPRTLVAVALVAACAILAIGLNTSGPVNAEVKDDPYDEAVTYQIASPSDTELAIKHYPPKNAPQYLLTIKQNGWNTHLKREIDWNRLLNTGLGKTDGVVLN